METKTKILKNKKQKPSIESFVVFFKMFAILLITSATLCIYTGCIGQEDFYERKGNENFNNDFFNYDMMQDLEVNVDFCFKQEQGYSVLFELYNQNPMGETADGTMKKKDIEPLYRGSTDLSGKYSNHIKIISDVTELWLYSEYFGTLSPVELSISNNRVSFNQNEIIKALQKQTVRPMLASNINRSNLQGQTPSNHSYPDYWTTLPGTDWDVLGKPNNLEAAIAIPPADVLYNMKEVYSKVKGKRIIDIHPEFFNGTMSSDVKIIKPTELSLVFINSGANFNNTIGYYTYKTGETPDKNKIRKILLFPNASPIDKTINGGGSLLCGHQIKLKYYDEENGEFKSEFPAGVSVGWWLASDAFQVNEKGNIRPGDITKGYAERFSTDILNTDQEQRVVSLRDKNSNRIVAIGFEDNIDFDYCDAVFYLETKEEGAVSGDMPDLPDAGNTGNNYITYEGTLCFEDLWPYKGDYDLNDVMVEYKSTVYRNPINNKVYKIVDEFTPTNAGGTKRDGFGYQLSELGNGQLRSVSFTVDGQPFTTSTHMQGQSLEPGQSHPTILLFDNVLNVVGKKIVVTMELNDVNENLVRAPYNPFTFVNERDKEVHLVNYPPTDKANIKYFGMGQDLSRPLDGLYYISVNNMPSAFHIPIKDFKPQEERKCIENTYPQFSKWAESKGTAYKDWYKHPKN